MVQHKIFDTLGFFILNRKLSTKPNIFPFGTVSLGVCCKHSREIVMTFILCFILFSSKYIQIYNAYLNTY